jgi:hypothetical protein
VASQVELASNRQKQPMHLPEAARFGKRFFHPENSGSCGSSGLDRHLKNSFTLHLTVVGHLRE